MNQELYFNILTFDIPTKPITFYFSKEKIGYAQEIYKNKFPSNIEELFPGIKEENPDFIYTSFIYEKEGTLTGPMIWLWENIAKLNNVSYSFQKYESDELLPKLKANKIDLTIYPLSITSDRSKSINFSVPFYLAHSGVMTKNLSNWDRALLFIQTFFSLNFYRALGTLALVILIFGFLEWRFERKVNQEEFGDGISGLWSGFWWSAVTMTTVGYGDKSPRTAGGRVVALIWMFTAVIIISGFTASITSSLTVTELETDMSTIDSFKNKRLATVENSGTLDWLNDNFFNNQHLFSTKEELIPALRAEKVDAIVYDLPLLNEMMKTDTLNEFNVLPVRFNPQYYAIGMNPSVSDSLQKVINTSLLENTERLEWDVVLAEYGLAIN